MTSIARLRVAGKTAEARRRPSPIASWLTERATGPMAPGSVLLHAPSSAFQAPGGGENQLVQTARSLEAQGVLTRPFSPWTDRLAQARLLHIFGMSREGLELAKVARAKRVPVVLSPICWVEPRAIAALAPDRVRRIGDLAKWASRVVCRRAPSWRRELLGLADAVLPNSTAEARQLVHLFGAEERRIRVVPNGVDERFAHADPSPFHAAHGHGPFVLYVGRIEPRKNVLGLVRAVGRAGWPLVVIGDPVPGHEQYADLCRRETKTMTTWIGRLDHDDPLLASAYAACRAFALPSWFETPGLAALEAALAGRAVVITPFGCTREYFGEHAFYARPDRPSTIVRALRAAWEAGPNIKLSKYISAHFLWSEVARKTAEAYDEVA